MCCVCVRERCALGAALLYELLYIRVFGVEEAELSLASEAFRLGGRRYRNSLSMCSDMDVGYELPETHRYGTAGDPQLESDWSVNVHGKEKKNPRLCPSTAGRSRKWAAPPWRTNIAPSQMMRR